MMIAIVSNIRAVRDAIERELRSIDYQDVIECFSFSNCRLHDAEKAQPNLILICAPSRDGIRLVQQVRETNSTVKIGVLATSDADDDEFIAWASIGICGYIDCDARLELVARTALKLAAGETIFPSRLSAILLHQFGRRHTTTVQHNPIESLTRRELAVIELLDEGLSNKQIARDLAITSATVKNHIHSILTKLDVSSRGSAAAVMRRAAPAIADRPGWR